MKKPETIENTQKTRMTTAVNSFAVKRAKVWDGGNVTADLEINGISIYGCRVVESEKGDFISWPSRKGSDGKYYHYAYCPLDRKDEEEILHAIELAINEG